MSSNTDLYFFTATILEWKPLLRFDIYKDIIISSLKYLSDKERIKVFAYVIMPNHIHLVWQIVPDNNYSDIRRDFLKFTSQAIKRDLNKNHPELLKEFYTGAKDRVYQLWERNPLSIELVSQSVLEQKINYIHRNPIVPKWGLATELTDYRYSSARFYYEGKDEFGLVKSLDELGF